ncbi:MAG: 7-cyano-7-deazaguanine synthase, partial [Planctomycetota bacterium]|nr:7-cyano-7-deazaguanine synthase [Planctomycetota bacterium]
MTQLLADTYRQLPDGVKRSVVCLSGGMDSSSLLLNLLADGQAVYGVSYDYGQKHKAELTKLKELLAYLNDRGYPIEHQVVDVSVLGGLFHSALTDESWKVPEGFYEKPNMKETVVPNRNAIF